MAKKVKFDITAKDKTKAAFSKVNKGLGAMKLAGIAAGAALIATFVKLSSQILKTGDQIQKLSIRLGISTEALSELRHVAALSGVKIEGLNTGLQRMIRRVSEAARGTGEARGALKELNVNAAALIKMKPDQMFEAIADAIFKIKDPADKVRIAFKLFDTEGVGFLQMMEQGAAGIRELRKETKTVFTREDADRIAAVNDSVTNFKDSVMAASKTILFTLIPAIESLGKVTSKVSGFFKGLQEGLKAFAGPQTVLAKFEADLESVDKKIARINKRITDSKGMKFWKQQHKDKAVQDLMALHLQRTKIINQSDLERQAILKKNIAEKEATKTIKDTTAAYVDADEEKKRALALERQLKRVLEELITPQEIYSRQIKGLNELWRLGMIPLEKYTQGIKKYTKEMHEATKAPGGDVNFTTEVTKNFEEIDKAAKAAADSIKSNMADAILSMKDGFEGLENVVISVLENIIRTMIQVNIVNPLAAGIESKFGPKSSNNQKEIIGQVIDGYNRNVGGLRNVLGNP